MIRTGHPDVSVTRRCQLLGVSRAGYYRGPAKGIRKGDQALTLARLSEEHGFISRNSNDLALGSRLRFIPNHACPVANLARRLVVVDGRDIYEWPVDARGRVR